MIKTLILSVLIIVSVRVSACDICGCSGTGNNFGILPQFQKNFIGVKYQYRSFHSSHYSLSQSAQMNVDNQFHNTDIWGRLILSPKLQLIGSIPFEYYTQTENQKTTNVKGLGDLSLVFNYIIFNPSSQDENKVRHGLQLGTGIKLPTGDYRRSDDGILINPNMQLGSGAFNIPYHIIYTMRIKQSGINLEMNGTINGTNALAYQFGNRYSGTIRYFYSIQKNNYTVLPQMAWINEYLNSDISNLQTVPYTGGLISSLQVTCDVYIQNSSIGIQIQEPIYQNTGNGLVNSKTKIQLSYIYLF